MLLKENNSLLKENLMSADIYSAVQHESALSVIMNPSFVENNSQVEVREVQPRTSNHTLPVKMNPNTLKEYGTSLY
jgi:hypothetical protein